MAFVWGDAGEMKTPDAVARKRKIAEAMIAKGTDTSPVQHWTQGASRVAQALLGGLEDRDADKTEKNAQAKDAELISAMVGGFGKPAQPSTMAGFEPPATTSPAPNAAAMGNAPASFDDVAPRLKTDLMRDFQLTPEQAAGVVGNLAHESAGFGTMQEVQPMVPGSRGGFGYAQWTGPRRKAFEEWAGQNKLDPTSYEANYGFLTHELRNTPEGGVLADLRKVNDPGAATQIFSDRFLRPGIPGMDSRQKWTQRAMALANAQADMPAPNAAEAAVQGQGAGFAIPGQPQPPAPGQFDAAFAPQTQPRFMQAEQAGQVPAMAAAPQQPPMPMQRPQADMPAPGAVEARGQLPMQPMAPEIDPNSNDAGAGAFARLGMGAPQAGPAPSSVVQALAAPAPIAPPVQNVAQAMAAAPGGASNPYVSALTSPYASPTTKKVAMAMLSQQMEAQKPVNGVQMGERLVDPRTGRVIADFSQTNGGKSNEYGLSPVYGVDKDGNPVVLQIGKRGDAVSTKLPDGVKLARDPIKVEGPTGTTLLDPQTRQQIGFVPKDNRAAERDKAIGKSEGEAITLAPAAIEQAQIALKTIRQARSHPGRDDFGATGWGANIPIIGSGLPNTNARGFVAIVDQIKGQTFLDAYQNLKGGGAITEAEGKKAEQARARLDRAQTADDFNSALNDLEEIISNGLNRAKARAGMGTQGASPETAAPAQSAAPAATPGKVLRYNPATGELE